MGFKDALKKVFGPAPRDPNAEPTEREKFLARQAQEQEALAKAKAAVEKQLEPAPEGAILRSMKGGMSISELQEEMSMYRKMMREEIEARTAAMDIVEIRTLGEPISRKVLATTRNPCGEVALSASKLTLSAEEVIRHMELLSKTVGGGLSAAKVKALMAMPPSYKEPDEQQEELTPDEPQEAVMARKLISEKAKAEMEALAEELTRAFKEMNDSEIRPIVRLNAPGSHTVTIPGKGYRKHNHIGGEEFYPEKAYVGATGGIIFVFKPDSATVYKTMEMGHHEALNLLDGFKDLVNSATGNFNGRVTAIYNIDEAAREQQTKVAKFDDYDDFGAF